MPIKEPRNVLAPGDHRQAGTINTVLSVGEHQRHLQGTMSIQVWQNQNALTHTISTITLEEKRDVSNP